MLESVIQKKITDRYKKDGWMVVKLIKTTANGIPDLLLLRNGVCMFIEVKSENGVLSEIQKYRIAELQKKRFQVLILNK